MGKEIYMNDLQLIEALARTEKAHGEVQNFSLRLDSENPEVETRAWKIIHNNVEKYAFSVKLSREEDIYVRPRDTKVIPVSDVSPENSKFNFYDIPASRREASLENHQFDAQARAKKSADAMKQFRVSAPYQAAQLRFEQQIENLNLLAKHFDIEGVDVVGSGFRPLVKVLEEVRSLQGGTLDLSSLPQPRFTQDIAIEERANDTIYYRPGSDPDLMSSDILYGAMQLKYKLQHKHDVKVSFEESEIKISIESPSGKVYSQANFPMVEGNYSVFEVPQFNKSVNITPEFAAVDGGSVYEKGRKVPVGDSVFSAVYKELASIAIIKGDYLTRALKSDFGREYGHYSHKGNVIEMQNVIRKKLDDTGVSNDVGRLLTPGSALKQEMDQAPTR
jgi:hypothetical protein